MALAIMTVIEIAGHENNNIVKLCTDENDGQR